MSQCRSCQAEIFWAETISGKRMPLDAEPIGKAIVLQGHFDPPHMLILDNYRSHFESCPSADEYRRPRT